MKPETPDRATFIAELAANILAGSPPGQLGTEPTAIAERAVAMALEIEKQAIAAVDASEVPS